MSYRTFLSVAAFTLLFSLLMFFFPQIDLQISGFFYHPGKGFLLENDTKHWYMNILRDILVWITYGFLTTIIILLLVKVYQRHFHAEKTAISIKIYLFLLICFAVAPALVVNNTLKDHWGRARPYQIQAFGGKKTFTPVWVISKQCKKNCSFTSGETANVFCYLALLFVIPRKKRLILTAILIIGTLTSLERVAQGHHFFSDVILSALLDYLLIWIIYYVMKNPHSHNLVVRNRELAWKHESIQ